MRTYILFVGFFVLGYFSLYSNHSESDTTKVKHKRNIFSKVIDYFQKSNDIDPHKKLDISFIGGPHYSSDTKLGLGLVASGLYRVDPTDLSISPSNVSIYGDFTTSGFYMLGIRGNTIFKDDNYRIDADMFFSSFPSKYWGIGYQSGRDDIYTKYKREDVQVKFDFLRKVARYTYVGATGIFQRVNGKDFDDISFLNGESPHVTAGGFGFIFSYDSRDFIPNPYSGIYTKIEQTFYPKFLGSSNFYNRTEIIGRYYNEVWNNGVIAAEVQGIFNNGNIPWAMMVMVGSSHQMRGYYEGQYRDKKLIQSQVELRQKVYHRNGVAVWIGAGNVFSKFKDFEWKQTLPTYGLGYRWEFKNRINVRLDYGFGKGQSAFYFNINEAF